MTIMEGTDGVCRRTFERASTAWGETFFEESIKPSSCSTNIGQMLIVTVSLTSNSTIGAVTLQRGNLSAAKVNPHMASQVELKK